MCISIWWESTVLSLKDLQFFYIWNCRFQLHKKQLKLLVGQFDAVGSLCLQQIVFPSKVKYFVLRAKTIERSKEQEGSRMWRAEDQHTIARWKKKDRQWTLHFTLYQLAILELAGGLWLIHLNLVALSSLTCILLPHSLTDSCLPPPLFFPLFPTLSFFLVPLVAYSSSLLTVCF